MYDISKEIGFIVREDFEPWEVKYYHRSAREYLYKMTPQVDLKIHLSFPFDWRPADQRPALLFFFGGGFRRGTVRQFERQAAYFASRGMVVARADYRVRDTHGATPDKCVEDAKSAMRWLRGHADRLGVDPERIVASGGSSGGLLAVATGNVEGLNSEGDDLSVSCRPSALLLLNPALGVFARERGRDWGLAQEVVERLTPIVTEQTPPMAVFFGTEDHLLQNARPFMNEAREMGSRVELYLAEGAQHAFFNDDPWFLPTLYQADEFLASLGYIEGKPTFEVDEAKKLARAD